MKKNRKAKRKHIRLMRAQMTRAERGLPPKIKRPLKRKRKAILDEIRRRKAFVGRVGTSELQPIK